MEKVYVGEFDENDLRNKVDKLETANAQKRTGLGYAITKIVTRKGRKYLQVWVCDLDTWVKEEKLI